MALKTLQDSPVDGVEYDPDVIDEDVVRGFLEPDKDHGLLGAAPDEDEELPDDVMRILEQGATQDEAIEVLRKAFDDGELLQDEMAEMSTGLLTAVDSNALFDEAVVEIKDAPALGDADPAIIEANAKLAGPAIRLVEVGDEAEIYFGDEKAFTVPLMAVKQKDIDKFIVYIQTVLDSMNLCFALLGVPKAAERKWAVELSKKLGKANKWLGHANKGFGYFKKAYNKYKDIRKGGKSKKAAALDTTGDFAKAFLGLGGVIFGKCLKIIKAILKLIFGSVKEIVKMCLKLLAAIATWVGAGWAKVAKAVIDAILAVIALWEDIEAWKKLSP